MHNIAGDNDNNTVFIAEEAGASAIVVALSRSDRPQARLLAAEALQTTLYILYRHFILRESCPSSRQLGVGKSSSSIVARRGELSGFYFLHLSVAHRQPIARQVP